MKLNEIQSGTQLFFPNALDGKVHQYNVEEIRPHKDDEKQRILWITNKEKARFLIEVWDYKDTKNSDHVEMFVPFSAEFGYGGWLCFYYTEKAAQGLLAMLKK